MRILITIVLIMLAAGVITTPYYFMCRAVSRNKDWEQEDEEQIHAIREWREKRGENS